jgi:hypothetical protein
VRVVTTALLGGLIALTLVAGGAASPQFASTFELTYSSQSPNSPSGFDVFSTWSDPGEPGGKPKEVVSIKLVYAPGTRLDTSALPVCRASDAKVQRRALKACPAATKVGSVRTEGAIVTGARFHPVSTLFNARRAIIVVVMLDGRLITNFRDDVGRSSVTINLKIPGGISLTSLQAHTPRHLQKRGKRRKAYMRTPPTCPASGSWTTQAIFSYRDGSTQTLSDETPCRSS